MASAAAARVRASGWWSAWRSGSAAALVDLSDGADSRHRTPSSWCVERNQLVDGGRLAEPAEQGGAVPDLVRMAAGEERRDQRIDPRHPSQRIVVETPDADRLALDEAVEDDLGRVEPDPPEDLGGRLTDLGLTLRQVYQRLHRAAGNGTPHLDAERPSLRRRHPGGQADEREGRRQHRLPGQAPGVSGQRVVEVRDLGLLTPDHMEPALSAHPSVGAPPALEAQVVAAGGPAAVGPGPALRGAARGRGRRPYPAGRRPRRRSRRRGQELYHLDFDVGRRRDGNEIVRECPGECEQLVRFRGGGDADHIDLAGE
jgi:hypothetical protein